MIRLENFIFFRTSRHSQLQPTRSRASSVPISTDQNASAEILAQQRKLTIDATGFEQLQNLASPQSEATSVATGDFKNHIQSPEKDAGETAFAEFVRLAQSHKTIVSASIGSFAETVRRKDHLTVSPFVERK